MRVDDIDGAAQAAFGGLPNSVFVINRNGCVLFRSDWNDPVATVAALDALAAGRTIAGRSFFKPAGPSVALRTLRHAGKGSVRDLPRLVWAKLVKRNLGTLRARPARAAADTVC